MNRPVLKKWLKPFRIGADLGVLDYVAVPARHLTDRFIRRSSGLSGQFPPGF